MVKTVELPAEGVVFPLKTEYDRKNHTLEGLTEKFLERQGPFDIPADFDPNRDAGRAYSDKWVRLIR